MSINVRPAKRIVEEVKKVENEVALSEKATELLESIEKMDTPEKLFKLEDKIAVEMTHDKIYEQFSADYEFLKKSIEDYLEGKPTSTDTIAKVARLRRNTRLCHYATAQMRKDVAERMEIVDAKLLQLQNVTSEVQHIQKEIDRCLDFSAGDENIELIPTEEFYKIAPETLSKPDETMGNEHEQYLARLKFENDQRIELLATLNELEGRRNVLQSDIRGKEIRLQGLKPRLEDLAKVAEPVFEMVGAKFKDLTIDEEQRQLSLTLPTPLVVAHIHACAYKELHDDKLFDFRIIGSNENLKLPKEDAESKRRRKDDETTQEKISNMASNMLDAHPMSLEYDIECSDGNFKVTMVIQYLTELKVTTVNWKTSAESNDNKSILFHVDSLMSDLFEGDTGNTCPDKVGELKISHLKLDFDATEKQIGKPYRFVQELTGTAEGGAEGVAVTEHLRNIIKSVRERISNRFVLDGVIRSLESRKYEHLNIDADVRINSFKLCDDEVFMASIPISLSNQLSKVKSSDRFSYKVELEDANSKKLTAYISIPADYPHHTALFGITAPEGSNADTVKEIEDRLNNEADYVDDVNSLKEQFGLLVKHVDLS